MKVGRREVALSHGDKVLIPGTGITKGDLIDYYRDVAGIMLPHVTDRALTLHRYPDGLGATGFYQQQASEHFPDWIPRVRLGRDETTDHAVITEAATLVYLANLATIELHTWLARVDRPEYPDRMVFDLDPADEDFAEVRFAARLLRQAIHDELGLACYVMTTGSRGLHLVVPLDRSSDFDAVRDFARHLADAVAAAATDRLTTEQRKNKRRGRLFLDTTRNAYGQTTVAPYSVRARANAAIATPLEWSEVDDDKLTADRWRIDNIRQRLARRDDPWSDIKRHAVKLSSHRDKLARIA